ncbi:hypothetical protein AMTR_s00020p00210430 [Amborella trichopoda]|uniref:Uncharacterized protein n=1 Tax=Amborella trichopoda TaxID=13333 RepID=W1PWY0_AMBTC|nr:hypothetical protein AMTR_s00020p00210430 [Amborella trichopoda]
MGPACLHLQIEPLPALRILLTNAMEVVAKERFVVVPTKPVEKCCLFLSNIEPTLMAYHEIVVFLKLPK